jgi:putative membrane protein
MMMGPMWMILWALVFIAVVAGAGVLIWRAVQQRGGSDTRPWSGAHDTLDERFARGEIDAEEYEQRRRTLDR